MRRYLKTAVVVLAFALLATACASDDVPFGDETARSDSSGETGSGGTATGNEPARRARLQAFGACDEFLNHMKAEAVERVGPYGLEGIFGGGGRFFGPEVDFAMEDEAMEESAFDSADAVTSTSADAAGSLAAPQAALNEGEDFSGTNNQVLGVDEPDIVKTDGNRIITVTENVIRVFSIDGADATQIGEITLDVYPRELLLDGDRLLVMSDHYGGPVMMPVDAVSSDAEASFASDIIDPGYSGPATVVSQIDISGSPTVLSNLRLEGRYVSARKIGGVARLVVTAPPPELSFIYPQGQGSEEIAAETNQRIIEESQLSDWLAEYSLTGPDGSVISSGAIAPCERIYRPSQFSGFGVLAVLTVDMQGELTPGSGTAVVTDGQTVYASNESLYVATNIWPNFPIQPFNPAASSVDDETEAFEESYTTALHRFDITDPTIANYVASGEAGGSMLSQFSMHEYDGRLHVATTQGSPWGFNDNSESFITVLEPQGQDLVEVGKVGDMGRGERIFAVRFIGSTAYVVTFRQVDPLYVVDLTDPTAPRVTGELKIPGFSSYLHPVGEGLLLGVGQDATDEGRSLGAKVSLFDVTDPTNPIERSTWTAPDGFSDVEWDHRAFLWWDNQDLAVMPLNDWRNNWSGAIALRVTADGITEIGRIDHARDETGEVAFSECRPVEIDDDRNWFGPDSVIEVCSPDDEYFWPDHYCEENTGGPEFMSEVDYMLDELGVDLELAPDERVQICWPDGSNFPPSIMRTLVIGDSLWSMSWEHLQSNALATLERTDREPISQNR